MVKKMNKIRIKVSGSSFISKDPDTSYGSRVFVNLGSFSILSGSGSVTLVILTKNEVNRAENSLNYSYRSRRISQLPSN